MPGVLHQHDGVWVYHRKDGALRFHGKAHSRHIPALDRTRRAKYAPTSRGYPHAGDGQPVHTGHTEHMKPKKIKGGGHRK